MNKNETALEMCLRMLKERVKFWQRALAEDDYLEGQHDGLVSGYLSAVAMLEYAMQNNIECLRQFDCYHEEEK